MPFCRNSIFDDTNYKTFKRTDKEARDLYYEELNRYVLIIFIIVLVLLFEVPFNEGWGQFDSKIAYDSLLKKMDPSRTADSTSGWQRQGCFRDVISKLLYILLR